MNMLWKRFSWWRHKCDICGKRTLIQHEVGLAWWVCNKPTCGFAASQKVQKGIDNWVKAREALYRLTLP